MDYPKTKEDVIEFLLRYDIDFNVAQKLFDEDVDGEVFIEITDSDLKELGVKLGPRKKILKIIQLVKKKEIDFKVDHRNSRPVHNYSLICQRSTEPVISLECPRSTEPMITLTEGPSTSTECAHVTPTHLLSHATYSDMDHTSSSSSNKYSFECPRSTERFIVLKEEPSTSSDSKTCQYFDPDEINVTNMLLQSEKGKRIALKLNSKQVISRTEISEIIRIAVSSMAEDLKTLYPSTDQKINLAMAIVRDIPILKSERTGVEGFEHLFCPSSREGAIEWRLKTLRLALPPSKKKRRSREGRAININKGARCSAPNDTDITEFTISEEMKNKINWLKFQVSSELNKSKIMEMMKATFEVRRLFIKRCPPVTTILETYPKFKDYSGALIDAEFQQLYPKADSLFERFQSFYRCRIYLYVQEKRFNIVERVGNVHDDNLCALLYLADLLPVSGLKRSQLEDADGPKCTSQALITFAGVDSSIQDIINRRKCQQPYLITTYKEDKDKHFFLVLDKTFIDVGSCPIKAFDILYKCHYVFNLSCQKQLTLLFNFMDHIIYKISHGSARSVVENMNNLLTNIKC